MCDALCYQVVRVLSINLFESGYDNHLKVICSDIFGARQQGDWDSVIQVSMIQEVDYANYKMLNT